MTKRLRMPIVWTVVIVLLLGGAHVIVARSGNVKGGAPAGYFH